MGDVNKRWSTGDRLDLSADWLNLTTENNRAYLRNRRGQDANAPPVHSGVTLHIMNVSGSDLAQYSIVGIGDQIAGPTDDDDFFYGDGVFNSASPASASPFTIIQDPAIDDEMALAIFSGPSYCRVSVSDAAHTYAAPSAGVYTHLVSQTAVGPAKILWKEAGGTLLNGAINDSVTNITVDDTDGFPGVPFVVTIGTEDLNVTAVRGSTQLNGDVGIQDTLIEVDSSANFPATPFVAVIGTERINVTNVAGTTWTVTRAHHGSVAAEHLDNAVVTAYADTFWTVTRGHNSTTPASHADNAAVSLKTGTVWALVLLDYQSSVSAGVTSINGDSTAAQVLSVGTSGTDFAITDTGAGTLRFDLPDAALTKRGVVTSTDQEFAGEKGFQDTVWSYDVGYSADSILYGFVHRTEVLSYQYSAFSHSSNSGVYIRTLIPGSGTMKRRGFLVCEPPTADGAGTITYHAKLSLRGYVDNGGGTGVQTNDNAPRYAIWESSTEYSGAWATVSGMVFKGGLYISGTLSVSASDVGLGSVENTALSTWAGTTNITTLGTITTGIWNGTNIDSGSVDYSSSSTDWDTTNPTTIEEALDRCAALLKTLNGGTGP